MVETALPSTRVGFWSVALPVLVFFCLCRSAPAKQNANTASPPANVAQTLEQARELLPPVLVRYKGGEIRREEVWPRIKKRVQRHLATGNPATPGLLNFLLGQVMPLMLDQRLLLPKAKAAGFLPDLTGAEQNAREIEKQQGTEKFAGMLREKGLTREEFVLEMAVRTAIKEWVERAFVDKETATDAQVRKFYTGNPTEVTRPELMRVSHILVAVESNAPGQQKAAARKKIEGLREELKAGVPFADLARRASDGRTAAKGGDVGYLARGQGRMGAAFDDAAFALKPGQISGVVETSRGLHLIKCEKHWDAVKPPITDIKERIARRVKEENARKTFSVFMKEIYADADLKFFYR